VRASKKVIFAADCAAFCCHEELSLKVYDEVDFAYLSPHKNLGGAEACGVLVARKEIMKSTKPTFPGGGTVSFVKGYTKMDVMYDVDIFNR
jgi:selenocysteine lyase/cysteine desulfurase